MGNEWKKVISEKKSEADELMTSKQLSDCNVAIHTASVAAAAGGAIPLPGVDAVPISAAQITMVIALGKVFDQKLTESAAKGIIGAAASTFIGRNIVKMIPVAGWIASAAVAAGITEAIGWSVAVDFAKISKNSSKNFETDHIITSVNLSDVLENDPTMSLDELEACDDVSTEKTGNVCEDFSGAFTGEEHEIGVQEERQKDEEDSDDESVANDFSKAFGEEEE